MTENNLRSLVFIFYLFLSFLILLPAPAFATTGPVGWWKFEEGSGTTAGDSSIYGNTGTLVNSPTWATGKIGGAVSVNGSSSYVDVGKPAALNDLSALTYSAWIYPTSLSSGNAYILDKDRKEFYRNSNQLLFLVSLSVTNLSGACTSPELTANTWTHVVWTWNGTVGNSSSVAVYVNGVAATCSYFFQGAGSPSSDVNSNLSIGAQSGGGGGYFTGSIDDVRVYDRALSPEEVRDLFFTRTTFITSGTTWTVPEDWKSSNNTIEAIGGGGGGNGANQGGGGGGAYAKITNLSLTPGASVLINVGAGGSPGNSGGDTWFNGANLAASSVGAKEGTTTGGLASASIGTTKYSGGDGGNSSYAGSGGGGSAGQNGNGANGGWGSVMFWAAAGGGGSGGGSAGAMPSADATGGNGGNNYLGAGSGAGGSSSAGSAGTYGGGGGGGAQAFNGGGGGNGLEWDSTHGAGGGGGGGGYPFYGANGGLYGGGGGGGYWGAGSGAQGIIAVTYPVTKPVGWWKFNDGTGTSAADSSGNSNTGTLTNGPVWTAVHTGNLALTFDGNDDRVDISDAPSLDITSAMTVSAWIKLSSLANSPTIVDKEWCSGDQWSYDFQVNSDGTLAWGWDSDGNCASTTGMFTSNAAVISTGAWTYVAVVHTTSSVTLYVNGVAVPGTLTGSYSSIFNSNSPVKIGAYRNLGGEYAGFFAGLIDDVRLYDYAMTGTEVSGLYNQTKDYYPADAGSDLVGWWKFDDGSGTNAADSSGFGHNGTITDGTWTTVKTGNQALTFNGSSSVVNTGTGIGSLITASDGSMSLWFYATYGQGACGSGQGSALANDGTGGGGYVWLDYDGTNLCAGGYDVENKNMSYPVNKNQWYHAVWVHTGGYLYLYVNGVQVNSMALGNIANLTNPFWIGETYNTVSYFGGTIDDVRVYNRALTAQEVSDLYSQTSSNYTQDLGTGLLAWWKMNEGTGTTTADASGFGHTGTLTSGPTWTTVRAGNKALSFNGSSNFVETSNFADNLPNFSVSAWFKTSASSQVGFSGVIVSKLSTGVEAGTGWAIQMWGADLGGSANMVQGVAQSDQNNWLGRTSDAFLNDNVWHHAVVVVTSTPTTTLYIDGSATATHDTSGGTITTYPTSSNVRIGNDYNSEYFNGTIDDVRIWGRALTAQEVSDLYYQTSSSYTTDISTGLLAWWKFDDSNVSPVVDSTGNGNNGTPASGVSAGARGKLQKAYSFDGTSNGYVTVPYTNMNFERTDAFSIALWAKWDSSSPPGNWQSFFARDINGNQGVWFAQTTSNGGGFGVPNCIVFGLSNPSYYLFVETATNSVAAGHWYHIVATYNGNSDASGIKIYLNGVSMPLTTVYNNLNGSIQTGTNWVMGDDGTGDYYSGSMDDLRVYGRVLTPVEVRRLFLGSMNAAGHSGD